MPRSGEAAASTAPSTGPRAPALLQELRNRYPHGTPTGTAVETAGHRLPARWILHAVGPVWRGGGHGEAELLAGAYRSCLALCDTLRARSVAFPAISMGIYAFPGEAGARIAIETVAAHLRRRTRPSSSRASSCTATTRTASSRRAALRDLQARRLGDA